ncbi:MAG: FecR family protein, partial [Verrucomicrobia bacterium]|nr:FecR family protein [Verrucomicrobiota bacterium]
MMNAKLLITLSAITALCLTTATLSAASFTEAKVTRLEKDVKILKENAAPRTASVGDNVNAVSSVATGPSSRAELKFPDNSLTRLGANSRFTIRGQGHTIDLDKGVLLFEVPEKLRDAKVRTAAVTAAVTGGTVVFELGPPLKVMCIEGTVDLYFNNDPTKFITLHAGQMTIKPDNATDFGAVVEFDLKLMLRTSKLLSGDGEPNAKEIA